MSLDQVEMVPDTQILNKSMVPYDSEVVCKTLIALEMERN